MTTDPARNEMVCGPSAYRFYGLALGSFGTFLIALIMLFVALVAGNGFLASHTLAANTFWVGWSCAVGLFCFSLGATALVASREVKAGYTTLDGFEFVERRDPRTGMVLRAAGDPTPTGTFTLKNARAYAAAHPVVSAVGQGPIRAVDGSMRPTSMSALLRAPRVTNAWAPVLVVVVGVLLLLLLWYVASHAVIIVMYLASFAAVVLPLLVVVVCARTFVRGRNSAVRSLYPGALLVSGIRSDELCATVRALELSPIPIRALFVWAIDESGVSLWQGGAPVRAFHLAWKDIADVQTTRLPAARLDGAAITFNIDASSGRTYRLPFQVAGRLDFFPEYGDVNVKTVAEINRRSHTTESS